MTKYLLVFFLFVAVSATAQEGMPPMDSTLSEPCQDEIKKGCSRADTEVMKPFLAAHPKIEFMASSDDSPGSRLLKSIGIVTYNSLSTSCQKEIVSKGLKIINSSPGAKMFALALGAKQEDLDKVGKEAPTQADIDKAWTDMKTDAGDDIKEVLFVPGSIPHQDSGYLVNQCFFSGSLNDFIDALKAAGDQQK